MRADTDVWRLWARRLAAVAIGAVLALAVAVPAVAYGWVSWDGIDPVVQVRNHQVSVYVEWPSEFTCSIRGDIDVSFSVPDDKDATLLSESRGTFTCNNGSGPGGAGRRVIWTDTDIEEGGPGNTITIATVVSSRQNFPVRVHVSVDGVERVVAEGTSNTAVQARIALP